MFERAKAAADQVPDEPGYKSLFLISAAKIEAIKRALMPKEPKDNKHLRRYRRIGRKYEK
jgi:hypothetical protein